MISTVLKIKEQYSPKRWVPKVGSGPGQLFSCARPGRSLGRNANVPDSVVCDWVANLPSAHKINIVSLLGLRRGGDSEFRYYRFRSESEKPQRPNDPTFQDWLDARFGTGHYAVIEHPTQDYRPIPTETLENVASTVGEILDGGGTAVLMDSGGDTRVTKVCKHMGFRKSTKGKGDKRGGPF